MVALRSSFVILSAYLATLVAGKLYESLADVPKNVQFDYIIVGGGNAGNVVANRLSENPSTQVLVLEAGNADIEDPVIAIPFYCLRIPYSYNWNYSTVAQPGLDGRLIDFPRGRVLGGSSTVNGMWYSRGSAEDWDRYAEVAGDDGWSWGGVQPYIHKSEIWTTPKGIDDSNMYEPSAHGKNGVTPVGPPGHKFTIDDRILKVSEDLPDEFPFNKDANDGSPLGLGTLHLTVGNGARASSASAYLAPKYLNRPNLHVLIHSTVSRVVKTGHEGNKPVFRKVEFRQGQDGSTRVHHLYAKREIILSAGVVGSPHILLNSGIGPKEELKAVGVHPIVDNAHIGKNFVDHIRVVAAWQVQTNNETFDDINRNPELNAQYQQLWATSRTGPLVNSFGNHWSFHRLPEDSPAFESGVEDPVAGPNTPHYEIGYHNGLMGPPQPQGSFFTTTIRTVAPASRGTVKLGSSDPFAAPLIDPAYLDNEFDMQTLMQAVRTAYRFVDAPSFRDYIVAPLVPIDINDDTALRAFIRSTGSTSAHPTGSLSFSAKGQPGALDPDLKVKGVEGLRVIDVSVLPFIPSAHTMAAAYIVGERGADLVKRSQRKQ